MLSKYYPTIKQTIWLLLFLLLIMMVVTLCVFGVVLAAGLIDSRNPAVLFEKYPYLLGVINFISIGIAVAWGYKKTKAPIHQVFPFRRVPVRMFLPISLTVIGLSIVMSDFDNLLRLAVNTPGSPDDVLNRILSSGNIAGSLLTLAVVAPLTEEFLFRGLILTGYLNNYSVKKAIWISAFGFAIFHLNLFQFPSALLSGVFFAWLVVKTRSLWASLFAHAINNSIPVIVCQVLQLQITGYSVQPVGKILFQPLWLDGLGLGLLALGLWLLWPELRGKLESPTELQRPQFQLEAATGEEVAETGVSLETSINTPTLDSPIEHPKLGVASLVLGIGSLTVLIVTLILSVVVQTHQSLPLTMTIGLVFIVGILMCLTGVGLGVAGVVKQNHRTITWIGIALNGIFLLFVMFAAVIYIFKT